MEPTEPASDVATRLRDDLRRLDGAHPLAEQGSETGLERAALVEQALKRLCEEAAPVPRTAVVALGGFGRGLLAPFSDIDVLLLHDGSAAADVEALAERLLYPLWDAGFKVGHAVRTPEECAAVAGERLDAATSMLDLRAIAGDAELADDCRTAVLRATRQDPAEFVTRLREAAAARHARAGSTAHLLEPDLKEGSGGLRDIDSVGWLQTVLGGSLIDKGVLRASERARLDEAHGFLFRIRSALHLLHGRPGDRLTAEYQGPIASALGVEDQPALRAPDALMRTIFEHARQVEHVFREVFERASGDPGSDRPGPFEDIDDVLGFLAEMAESGGHASAAALDEIEAARFPEAFEWTDATQDAFLRLLRAGDGGVRQLEAADRVGVLIKLLPGWGDVRCRPQRDPYHRYTVDAHLMQACAAMARMLSGADAPDAIAVEAAETVTDRDGALLGALLHDIGKIGQGGHVQAGSKIAAAALERMRIPGPSRDLAAFMVADHLLLPDTATRRDLTDEELIRDIATRVGSPQRLAALYLLALADATATGPAAWTPWRQTLVRELVAKIQSVFEDEPAGTSARSSERIAERLAERTDALRQLLHDEPAAEVDRFILRMPRAYFLAVPPDRAAAHFPTVWPPVGSHDLRTATTEGTKLNTHELLVVASDRPGLLSWIAGSLSLAGLTIRSAQVFTTDDGTAVDLFDVEGVFEEEIDEERWRGFRTTLRKVIEGRISLDSRVAEKRRYYPESPGRFPVTVKVYAAASDFFTVIEVGAADRIGLLYDITRALADLKLDVHLAKVATYSGRVVDSFYVRGATRGDAGERTEAIRGSIRSALDG